MPLFWDKSSPLQKLLCLLLLFPAVLSAQSARSAQSNAQRSLSLALRNTPAVGIVLAVNSGKPLAEVGEAAKTSGAPGSILKPFFLADALRNREILPQTSVFCTRSLHITDGPRDWNLACTHPQTNIAFSAQQAVAYSCNTYFAALADRLSPAQATAILEHYGVGQAHVPETREQKQLLVLGLTGISVSAQQIARAYRKLAGELNDDNLRPVRDGLKESVAYGMAHNADVPGMELAGKTGTVNNAGWFAGIGAFNHEPVVAVIYLPQANGADAARLARSFFRPLKTAPASAKDLTIELWTARSVTGLTATPLGGAGQPIRFQSGAPIKTFKFQGNLRVQPDDAPGITAAGDWTIVPRRDGLRVLLTLPSEDYVAAALRGEAAPDEPMASLKAMAVAIRTFALLNAGRHQSEGFDLCDSTHCQALRWDRTRPEIQEAVRETAGETLWSGQERLHVYYTQHCGGMSEAASSVWPGEQGGDKPHPDPYCLRRSPAQWHARISLQQLSTIFHSQGWQMPSPINSIQVIRKTATGRAELLQVTGNGPHAQLSASSFRFAVDRALGWNQLRSDWYSIVVSGEALEIQGRGYGHGVGLCQAGAYEMAKEGRTESEILHFYFPTATRGITTSDSGWRTIAGAGWTLSTVDPSTDLVSAGNIAWAKAQSLFGSPNPPVHPTVEELPTTELFRQTTGEPGWMLASTRGTSVFLQPAPVCRSNSGDSEALLLHEFLHVLVEQQAGEKAPLWLREGLVEMLPGQPPKGPIALPVGEVDTMLAHPASPAASRAAHQAAAQMAARLCSRYGMDAVRNFLRSGVPSEANQNLRTDSRSAAQ
jgi:stage II sporulation protein D